MTPEEAIGVIKTEIGQFIIDEKWKNALALAISALEKQDAPEANIGDTISRQSAIDALCSECQGRCVPCDNYPCGEVKAIEVLPSAQPERLTDDDFETIRIHLSAYKERLCNQHRWEEAEEYQRIIDRFMRFASAQPEIIHCKDCYNYPGEHTDCPLIGWGRNKNDFCSRAERRTDEGD